MTNTIVSGQAAGNIGPITARQAVMADRTRARSRRASRNMLLTAATIVIAVFLLVGLSAYAASIQHANNVLTQENAYLQAEIDSLNSQIVEETKVTRVEQIATEKYGMIYPTSANCIVINEDKDNSSTNLAAVIRRDAYN